MTFPAQTRHRPAGLRAEAALARGTAAAAAVALALAASAVTAHAQAADAPTTPTPTPTTPTPTTPVPTTPAPGDDAEDEQGVIPAAPTRAVSYAARLVVPTTVRRKPSVQARVAARLKPFGSWNGGPVVLSIAEVRAVGEERWLRVRLPGRPNGTTGWVQQDRVEVTRLRHRLIIDRRSHRLTLLRDGKKIGSTSVVIGAARTPTPAGTFAVLEVVRQPKGEVIGPWALHLTAHSNVLDNYGGGPGRVALHGRSGALMNDPLGSSRSHGCIRMPNAFITRLAEVAVEGTPVQIR